MIVFDKTGTLTKQNLSLNKIIPFNGHDADEMLKLAACIEEHFPHSMAKQLYALLRIMHLPQEMHSDVEYVVAHGIASKVGRYRVRIGECHYIFDDEKDKDSLQMNQEKFNNLPNSSSHIYPSLLEVH